MKYFKVRTRGSIRSNEFPFTETDTVCELCIKDSLHPSLTVLSQEEILSEYDEDGEAIQCSICWGDR